MIASNSGPADGPSASQLTADKILASSMALDPNGSSQSVDPYASGIGVNGTGANNAATVYKPVWDPKTNTWALPMGVDNAMAPIYSAADWANVQKGLQGSNEGTNKMGGMLDITNKGGGGTGISYTYDPKTGYYIPTSAQGVGQQSWWQKSGIGDVIGLAAAAATAGAGLVGAGTDAAAAGADAANLVDTAALTANTVTDTGAMTAIPDLSSIGGSAGSAAGGLSAATPELTLADVPAGSLTSPQALIDSTNAAMAPGIQTGIDTATAGAMAPISMSNGLSLSDIKNGVNAAKTAAGVAKMVGAGGGAGSGSGSGIGSALAAGGLGAALAKLLSGSNSSPSNTSSSSSSTTAPAAAPTFSAPAGFNAPQAKTWNDFTSQMGPAANAMDPKTAAAIGVGNDPYTQRLFSAAAPHAHGGTVKHLAIGGPAGGFQPHDFSRPEMGYPHMAPRPMARPIGPPPGTPAPGFVPRQPLGGLGQKHPDDPTRPVVAPSLGTPAPGFVPQGPVVAPSLGFVTPRPPQQAWGGFFSSPTPWDGGMQPPQPPQAPQGGLGSLMNQPPGPQQMPQSPQMLQGSAQPMAQGAAMAFASGGSTTPSLTDLMSGNSLDSILNPEAPSNPVADALTGQARQQQQQSMQSPWGNSPNDIATHLATMNSKANLLQPLVMRKGMRLNTFADGGGAKRSWLDEVTDWLHNRVPGHPAPASPAPDFSRGFGGVGDPRYGNTLGVHPVPDDTVVNPNATGPIVGPHMGWTGSDLDRNIQNAVDKATNGMAQGGLSQAHPRFVSGGTPGQADAIDAKLSDGEYVMDADAVSALGDGNNAAGAAKLDQMRENIRAHKRSAPSDKIPPKAKDPMAYLGKGSK